MKCLIYANTQEADWLKSFFPDIEPFLLKIANKPLLEYILDLVVLMGVDEVRIVSDGSIKQIEQLIGSGSKWGCSISYSFARPQDSINKVYAKNLSFCQADDLIIWNGFFFAFYHRDQVKSNFKLDQASYLGEQKRLILLPKGSHLKEVKPINCSAGECMQTKDILGITDYFQLSMEILKERSQEYVLPGYGKEKGIFLGSNLVYPRSCELKPPIMIGNNCSFQRQTLVGPNSIIGNNVIIDENSCVNDSIVYDNTYVGRDLDLDHKIVYKGHLISGLSGESIHITDKLLVSQVELGIVTSFFNRFVQRILAIVLLLLQLVPWLILFMPYCLIMKCPRTERILSKSMKPRFFYDTEPLAQNLWGRFLIRLSLDKFDQILSAALGGSLFLVGNRLFANSVKHRNLITQLPVYNPGAFSLSECMKAPSLDVEAFYELEYIDKVSTLFNLRILFNFLWHRLRHGSSFSDTEAE